MIPLKNLILEPCIKVPNLTKVQKWSNFFIKDLCKILTNYFFNPTIDLLPSADEGSQWVALRQPPCLYSFCGGSCALFSANGYRLLINGGQEKQSVFWKYVTHVPRLDAIIGM